MLHKHQTYDFLNDKMVFTSDDGYQNFLVFVPMFSSLILDSNKKVINWISIRISSKKIESFDTNLETTVSNLANGRVILKSSNSALVEKINSSSLYSNLVLNLYIVYELNN